MVDSEVEFVGCSRIEGEECGTVSQQSWVFVLVLLELVSFMTLASHAGLRDKPICPGWPLCSSNKTKPGTQPAHCLAFSTGRSLTVSAASRVVRAGGLSPF